VRENDCGITHCTRRRAVCARPCGDAPYNVGERQQRVILRNKWPPGLKLCADRRIEATDCDVSPKRGRYVNGGATPDRRTGTLEGWAKEVERPRQEDRKTLRDSPARAVTTSVMHGGELNGIIHTPLTPSTAWCPYDDADFRTGNPDGSFRKTENGGHSGEPLALAVQKKSCRLLALAWHGSHLALNGGKRHLFVSQTAETGDIIEPIHKRSRQTP
jgi:hypothetical protein